MNVQLTVRASLEFSKPSVAILNESQQLVDLQKLHSVSLIKINVFGSLFSKQTKMESVTSSPDFYGSMKNKKST